MHLRFSGLGLKRPGLHGLVHSDLELLVPTTYLLPRHGILLTELQDAPKIPIKEQLLVPIIIYNRVSMY